MFEKALLLTMMISAFLAFGGFIAAPTVLVLETKEWLWLLGYIVSGPLAFAQIMLASAVGTQV